jgi:hypothetical protein
VIRFGPLILHDLRSVTKSIVGLLYGITLAAGRVPRPEAKLYEQFPKYREHANDPARQLLTVGHACRWLVKPAQIWRHVKLKAYHRLPRLA